MKPRDRFLALFACLLFLACHGDMAQASPYGGKSGKRWLLAVGVTGYTKVPPLRGCENDARLIADVLEKNCGFDKDCVRVLDRSQTTKKGIEAAFREWLIEKAGPGDVAVFYFSGHGTQATVGKETHEGLCPMDVDPTDPSTLILDRDLSAWIAKVKAEKVIVVLDACHSGTNVKALVIGSSPKFAPMREGPATPDRVAWLSLGKNIEGFGKTVLLAACQASEIASDTQVVGENGQKAFHGAFTYALGQILGKLDPERAASVGYEDLLARVRRMVRYDLNELQTPVLRGAHGDLSIFSLETLPPLAARERLSYATPTPSVTGRSLLVALKGFEGDAGAAAASGLRTRLASLSFVRVVKGDEAADVVLLGRMGPTLKVEVCAPSGRIVKAMAAPSTIAVIDELVGELRRIYSFAWLARLQNPSPSFHVSLTADRAQAEGYQIGDLVNFRFKSDRDCYLTLVDIGTGGSITVLFPNAFHADSFVKAGQVITIPGDTFRIRAAGPPGREMVVAVATTRPCALADLVPKSPKSPLRTFEDVQEFRQAFLTGLAKGIVVQETPLAAPPPPPDWAEASTVLLIR